MTSLSGLDWVIVLVVLFSVIHAASLGFFREFFALAGVVAGYLVAAWEFPHVAAWYAHYMNSPWPADIAAFFTIFGAVAVLAGIVGRMIGWAAHKVGLRWFDRLLGAAFGVLRGVLISVVLVLALATFAPQWGLQRSRIAPALLVAGRGFVWAAPADFRRRFWDGWNLLRSIPQHIPAGIHSGDSNP